jgi:hypothetical protein
MTEDAFFVAEDGRFVATELTRGPWDPHAQHAGPPAALIGRTVERAPGGDGKQVARITFEILRPIPIAALEVTAEVVRRGRRVDLVEATLSADGETIVLARAWRMVPGATAAAETPSGPALHGPESGEPKPFFPTGQETGYHTGMEVRFLEGGFVEPGPATAWMRMRVPLVAGEAPSPLSRVLVAADSGNGLSAVLDPGSHLFINTDLTVHLHGLPVGEWVCLDAVTTISDGGVGLAESTLHDETGPIGRGLQSLYVSPRA